MREIKFRAWDREEKVMIPTFLNLTPKSNAQKIVMIHVNKLLTCELMQFTGLTDKHGKEMYEGDIIEYLDNTSRGLVKKIVVITDTRHLPDFSCSKWEEIIGNVHQNPELLQQIEN